MKIKLLLFLTAIFCLCSCEDTLRDEMLDENNQSASLPESIDLEHAIMTEPYKALNNLQSHNAYLGLSSVTTDESIAPIRLPDNDWNDGREWNELCSHQWDINNEVIQYTWGSVSNGIQQCNEWMSTVQTYKEKLTPVEYRKFMAELRVLRAYYYYVLLDCFGQVYIYDDNLTDGRVCASYEVWKEIVQCIETEVKYLPLANETDYGRVTQGMAYTLLARLYLNAESFDVTVSNCGIDKIQNKGDFYTQCILACDNIINSGVYHIESEYYKNFATINDYSTENIFVAVNDPILDLSYYGNLESWMILPLLTMPYEFQYHRGWMEKPWNGFCATTEFLSLFTGKYNQFYLQDKRGPCDFNLGTLDTGRWGWFIGPIYHPETKELLKDEYGFEAIVTPDFYTHDEKYYFKFYLNTSGNLTGGSSSQLEILNSTFGHDLEMYEPLPYGITEEMLEEYNLTLNRMYADKYMRKEFNFEKTTTHSGARSIKYEIDKNPLSRYYDNDFVIFRYADVLYMKAEAILRGGEGNVQALLLNADFRKIRTRVNMPEYTSLDLEELIDERGREFVFENVRRRDLIRYGLFTGGKYLWGIKQTPTEEYKKWFPIPERYISSGIYMQNIGY